MNTKTFTRFSKLLLLTLTVALLFSAFATVAPTSTGAGHQAIFIVKGRSTDLAARLVQSYGGVVTSRLEIIQAVGARLSEQAAARLRLEPGILSVTPNGAVNSSDSDKPEKNKGKPEYKVPPTDYPEVVGADLVWEQGVTGTGVTVAVLDTGLGMLPALAKNIKNKPGRIVAWKDFVENSKKPVDPNGHGSHIAGIIANSQTDDSGEWNGIAPGVNLAGVRVLNAEGFGTYETVILGLQWVLENQARYNIKVVNLSMVAPVDSPYWADPLNQAVTQLWANGLTVVVAAGNSGSGPMSITVPGNNPYVITVGAFTDNYTPDDWNDDYLAPFSGAGPTLDGFVKPDLVAPGTHMVSVIPQDSVLALQYPDNRLVSSYFSLAGTSQATAAVSGIAALVLAQDPALTPDQVKQRLTGTALPWVDMTTTEALYSMWQQGAGRVNAYDAVFAAVDGIANQGLDIQADLDGTTHYEGYSYFDETTGTYRLYEPFAEWTGAYANWDGSYEAWTGGKGAWIGDYGLWASGKGAWIGAKGAWIGGKGAWIGGKGAWIGAKGAWIGAKGAWIGGYTLWAGGKGAWIGGKGAWIGGKGAWIGVNPLYADPAFVDSYFIGQGPDASISNATISFFLQDP